MKIENEMKSGGQSWTKIGQTPHVDRVLEKVGVNGPPGPRASAAPGGAGYCELLLQMSHVRSVVCVSVCVCVGTWHAVRCAKMAVPIDMQFAGLTYVGPRNHVLDGVQMPKAKGYFLWGHDCAAHCNIFTTHEFITHCSPAAADKCACSVHTADECI